MKIRLNVTENLVQIQIGLHYQRKLPNNIQKGGTLYNIDHVFQGI